MRFGKRWRSIPSSTALVSLAQQYAATGKQEQAEQELLLATKADPENEGIAPHPRKFLPEHAAI